MQESGTLFSSQELEKDYQTVIDLLTLYEKYGLAPGGDILYGHSDKLSDLIWKMEQKGRKHSLSDAALFLRLVRSKMQSVGMEADEVMTSSAQMYTGLNDNSFFLKKSTKGQQESAADILAILYANAKEGSSEEKKALEKIFSLFNVAKDYDFLHFITVADLACRGVKVEESILNRKKADTAFLPMTNDIADKAEQYIGRLKASGQNPTTMATGDNYVWEETVSKFYHMALAHTSPESTLRERYFAVLEDVVSLWSQKDFAYAQHYLKQRGKHKYEEAVLENGKYIKTGKQDLDGYYRMQAIYNNVFTDAGKAITSGSRVRQELNRQ